MDGWLNRRKAGGCSVTGHFLRTWKYVYCCTYLERIDWPHSSDGEEWGFILCQQTAIPGRTFNPKGMTLIELLTVLMILAVLFSIGAGTFGPRYSRYQLKTMARDLVSDMRLARQQAASENWQYAVRFISETSYEVVRGDQPLLQSSQSLIPVIVRNRKEDRGGRWDVDWIVPERAPVFQPDGVITSWKPDDGSYSTELPDPIVLTNSQQEEKTVTLSRFGRIKIE